MKWEKNEILNTVDLANLFDAHSGKISSEPNETKILPICINKQNL